MILGVVMQARIGMLRMHDSNQEDFKIIAVHANDPMYSTYNDISKDC